MSTVDGEATTNIVKWQLHTTLCPENMVTLSRQNCLRTPCTRRKGTLPELSVRPWNAVRLASVRMGELVNTVGRTFSSLVAKAFHFKIRLRDASSLSRSSLSRSRLFEDCCVFPHHVNTMHSRRMRENHEDSRVRPALSISSFLFNSKSV